MEKIQPLRGTHDFIGHNIILYRHINKIIHEIADYYDFNEIITPIIENTELFKKPLGEHSDVVLKEMYSFQDGKKSMITLRPEYTASIIRAAISNNLFDRLPIKLFGIGPMFRRERPQKGRFRQFNQINFEILGTTESNADVELIVLANEFIKNLKINSKVNLYINSLGDEDTLCEYKKILTKYYNKYRNDLSNESKAKIDVNPLRILDSKKLEDLKINSESPKIDQFYSKKAKKFFEDVQQLIDKAGIVFSIDKNLVRGLDYYCHTVFEFKSDELGNQNTLIGGGRYDGLVKNIGGPDIPGVGWASGIERLMMIHRKIEENIPIAQIIPIDQFSKEYCLDLLVNLRKLKMKIRYDYKHQIKKSLKKASESKIKFAIIVGEKEIKNNNYTLKNLFDSNQKTVSLEELKNILQS